jgi:16S rRNA (uracil1498-N3)-methyltransferase
MNSLILENDSGLITDSKILEHLKTTLNAKVGDSFRCTVLNRGIFWGELSSLEDHLAKIILKEPLHSAKPWFNLVVGLSRPQTVRKILEHATTFGANRIHFFKAELSEKSYQDSKALSEEKDFLVRAGLSQSALYYQLPEIKVDKYNPANGYSSYSQKYILDLEGAENFLAISDQLDFNSPITLAIGPERGFIKADIERFHQAGFKSIKVSSSILRVEHAVYSAISQLELIRGQY